MQRLPFRFGVRAKLFLASISVIAIAVIVAHAYLSSALDRMLTDRIRGDLFVRLALVERETERVDASATTAEWDALADDLGARAGARVTFIASDGRVLGDSEVPLDRIASVENHLSRPEIQDALRTGHGSATRLSDTIQKRLLYAAEPMKKGGFVRVALPLVEVEGAEAQLRQALLIGTLLALALATVMSFFTAQLSSRVVGHLTNVANAMAKGDFDARARLGGGDEFTELGRALDQLADSLSVTMRQLRAERDRVGRILSG
ncbi:MAG TPA: HAMP domain-containing protein, partial [Polyangiaceae bacterium]